MTAAYELLDRTDIQPIILEMTGDLGGISKTVNYKGNRIDIGGHRFFSKSGRVTQWWKKILPLQGAPSSDDLILERQIPLAPSPAPDPEKEDRVMLYRQRLSRIFYLRKFFNYPVALNLNTVMNLGIVRIFRIFFSYLRVRLAPIKHEKSLEDFLINRFGRELYATFFKDYTEKVWGVPCHMIKPEWGAQRIKGLSITKAVVHAMKSIWKKDRSIDQKTTETSLIEQFMYPKYGPGQMWEQTAKLVREKGAPIHLQHKVVSIRTEANRIVEIAAEHQGSKERISFGGDYFFSTMPVKDLVAAMGSAAPSSVQKVAGGLVYRDFMTVGLLLKKLAIKNETKFNTVNNIVPDNWIYIQEPDVKICRLQVFNNWSPYMAKDPNTVWLGLEYLCNEGDALWNQPDEEFSRFAAEELVKIKIIEKSDILDSVVIRMPKAYPAYFGTYEHFSEVRRFLDGFENLFLIGRNGMHRYNNQDHSMFTAMAAVDNIVAGIKTKDNIWSVNVEKEYHEEKITNNQETNTKK